MSFIPIKEGKVINLKEIVGGMINMMSPQKIEELESNPDDLASFFTGKKEEHFPSEVVKATPGGKQSKELELETGRNDTLEIINELTKREWEKLHWGTSESSLKSVRYVFKSAGLDVQVSFFREHPNFIIVAEGNTEKQKGIVIPRKGMVLSDLYLVADLFEGAQVGKKVTVFNLVSFPEVEYAPIKEFGKDKDLNLYWKVTKLGKLK